VSVKVLGEPFTIQENVAGDTSSGSGYFAVGAGGVLALAPETSVSDERVIVLVDQNGKETEVASKPDAYNHPRFSPDGRKISYSVGSGAAADDDVFTLDVATGASQRLTFGKGQGGALWSADGRSVYYVKGRSGETGVAWKAADGTGAETLV